MNRNKIYIVIGGLIAIILIGLLIYLMNSESDLSPKQTYKVEIYHCGPIAKDATLLTNEMSAFLLSSPIPSTTGFIAPVVDLHEKLKDGEVHSISIPMSGLTGLREMFVSDYYDYNARKEEEGDFIGEHGNFFTSEKFLSFSASALNGGDQAVDRVPYNKENCITEFFIYANQPNINSADNKVWNSLASLKKYINGLITQGKITSDSVIKVYYTFGLPGPPPSDSDKDGVVDNDDQCPNEKGQAECSGCPCPPPPACPGDSDSDRDGICDSEDKCPNEFGTKKYGGCKIPDSDGDGYNDEIDKCSNESSRCCGGCPDKDGDRVIDKDDDCDDVAGDVSNRGCPKISIQFQVGEGQFLVSVPNTVDFTAELVIIESSGKKIVHALDKFNNMSFGGPEIDTRFKDNYEKLYKSIQDPLGLDIMVVVKNNKGQIVKESPKYKDMTMICFSSGQCGFIKM